MTGATAEEVPEPRSETRAEFGLSIAHSMRAALAATTSCGSETHLTRRCLAHLGDAASA